MSRRSSHARDLRRRPRPAWQLMQVGATVDTPDDFIPFTYTEGLTALGADGELWLPHHGACGHTLGRSVAGQIANAMAVHAVGIERLRELPSVPVALDALDSYCRIGSAFGPGAVADYLTGSEDTITLVVGDLVDGRHPEVGTWSERTYPLSWTCSFDSA